MEDVTPRLLNTRVVAVLLVVAPLCEVVEAVLSPLPSSGTRADLVAIRAHEGQFVVSVLVGLLGTLLLLPAILGLAARTVGRSPWASRVAAGLAVPGLMGFAGIRLGQGIELQGIRDGVPLGQVAGLLDHQSANPVGAPLVILFLAGTAVGLVALAAAVWRAGLPRPAAVLIGVFPFADQALEQLGTATGVVAHALLLVGFAWVAVSLTRGRATAGPAREPLPVTA